MSTLNCFGLSLSRSHHDKAETHDHSIVGEQNYEVRQDHSVHGSFETKHSPLLCLPKELRLKIWNHVLTDTSISRLYVCISRRLEANRTPSKRYCNSLYKHTPVPDIEVTFRNPRTELININLLRVSHLIYGEALPVLYRSTTFCLSNFEGIFPIFLDTLSNFAKSHIRYILLDTRNIHSHDSSFINWALTCAQVAKLNESLQLVEIGGSWPIFPHLSKEKNKRFNLCALLYPLLKIKAPKKFVSDQGLPGHDAEFQLLIKKAAKDLESKLEMRRALTAADATEREKQEYDQPPAYQLQPGSDTSAGKMNRMFPAHKGDDEITDELSTLLGFAQFEQELLDWDLVSIKDSRTSEAGLSDSNADDTWIEAASTIVGKDEDTDVEEQEDWELIKTPSLA